MTDLTHYLDRLNHELATITAELETIGYLNETTDNWEAKPDTEETREADLNNEADAVEEWNERRSTLETLEIEYRDLKRALGKITDGTYGICELCQAPIEEARLEAKATARTCSKHMDEEAQLPL